MYFFSIPLPRHRAPQRFHPPPSPVPLDIAFPTHARPLFPIVHAAALAPPPTALRPPTPPREPPTTAPSTPTPLPPCVASLQLDRARWQRDAPYKRSEARTRASQTPANARVRHRLPLRTAPTTGGCRPHARALDRVQKRRPGQHVTRPSRASARGKTGTLGAPPLSPSPLSPSPPSPTPSPSTHPRVLACHVPRVLARHVPRVLARHVPRVLAHRVLATRVHATRVRARHVLARHVPRVLAPVLV
ncbi:hypothetical protein PLICRDRAFT_176521 [Plicaturopsis crispa FD-325 SS-3]|nr:hypothetical protein PLICRDRAFT_176521 [Plicaturopsis crispa FD-325 SS-3]